MRDGYTQKVQRKPRPDPSFEEHRKRWRAVLVIVSGGAEGTEFELDQPQMRIGRGADVEVAVQDQTMSREHAAVEFSGGGYRVRDLGSMNGILHNDCEVKVGELASGDRIQVGEHVFQFVLEKREGPPKTYVLEED